MKVTDTELREIVRSQAARRRTSLEPCLSEELLRRAATNGLDRRDREAVAAHLAVCADCVRDYRVAHSVKAWAEQATASRVLPLDSAVEQESNRVQLLAPAGSRGRFGWAISHRFLPYAIAASLIALAGFAVRLVLLHGADRREVARLNRVLTDRDRAILDLQKSQDEARSSAHSDAASPKGTPETDPWKREATKTGTDQARIAQLEKVVKELSRPRLNVPIVDLEPSSARGEPAHPITTIEVPSTADLFTLILHASGKTTGATPGYLLEIVGSNGRLAYRGRGIKNTADGGLTIALSHRLIRAGKYTINLYDRDRKHSEPIERYVVEVHYR